MDLTESILDELIRVQERADLVRHGEGETPGGLGLAEVHCVDWIGRLERANVTRIAQAMSMTRGAVSKIARRLVAKRLVESYRLPGNNKEVCHRLTASGERVFAEHRRCHEASRRAKAGLLDGYSEAEMAAVHRFLIELNRLPARRAGEES